MRIILSVVILLASCGKPKVQTVEKQKVLKDSIEELEKRIAVLHRQQNDLLNSAKTTAKYNDLHDNPDYKVVISRILQEGLMKERYQKSYDSLEMELRKH